MSTDLMCSDWPDDLGNAFADQPDPAGVAAHIPFNSAFKVFVPQQLSKLVRQIFDNLGGCVRYFLDKGLSAIEEKKNILEVAAHQEVIAASAS